MPDIVLTTNDTSSYLLTIGEHYFLAEGVTQSVTANTEALELTGNDHNVYVNGTIVMFGNQNAIYASGGADEDVSIIVGASGSVLGNNSYFGILTEANEVVISNAGNVVGGTAIGARGDSTQIMNTGTIISNFTSGSVVFTVDMSGEDAQFNNAGIIQGNYGVEMNNTVEFINSGTITASSIAVRFNGNFEDTVNFANSGTITSSVAEAIEGGENDGFFINTGQITGLVDLEGGADTLQNSGTITGEILMAEGDDILQNSGTIFGNVDLFSGADTYTASGSGLVTGAVNGGIGNDTITGAEADDILNGDDDIDIVRGNSGEDTINGGDGNDFLYGGADDDFMNGNADDDLIRGNSGNDELLGAGGADKIFGGAGDDEITGGALRDVLRGNAGADTFIYLAESDSTLTDTDRIRDFQQGEDLIDISAIESFTFVGDAAFSGTAAEVRYQTTSSGLRFEMDIDGDGTADMRVNMNNVSTMTAEDFIL